MAFELNLRQPLATELLRLLQDEIGGALGELAGTPDEAAIHAARRHIKKARATLRLLGGDVHPRALVHCENGLRAAGHALAPCRDAAVLLRTIDALSRARPPKATASALQALRQAGQTPGTPQLDAGDLTAARLALQDSGATLTECASGACDFDTLARGFATTYRAGRRALKRALRNPDAERLHALRRQLKHHLYHLRLLRPLWPGPLGAVHAQADRAADLLGLHHDCAVLRERLAGSALPLADQTRVDTLATRRQDRLAPEALDICRRLYAERGGSYRRRLKTWWRCATQAR
ncbi:MAG TPA: CHAD domain-containing protein [Immundisolibacter sp.]|nr:CHAD domain-containing protein [Immundisolibacter sp.]